MRVPEKDKTATVPEVIQENFYFDNGKIVVVFEKIKKEEKMKKINYKLYDGERHDCIKKDGSSETCLACMEERELKEKKEKGEIVDYYFGGGRRPVVVEIFEDPDGQWEDIEVVMLPAGEKYWVIPEGVIVRGWGEDRLIPDAEVLEEFPDSVHGADKIKVHQTSLVLGWREKISEDEKEKKRVIYRELDEDYTVLEGLRNVIPYIIIPFPLKAIRQWEDGKYFFGKGCWVDIRLDCRYIVGEKEFYKSPVLKVWGDKFEAIEREDIKKEE